MSVTPQLENGYTQIADAILEKVAKTKLNGTQFRILMVVWRSTYGWSKKEHELSLGYLSIKTDIHKQQIKREVDKMIEDGILVVISESTHTKPRTISFDKNYAISLQSAEKYTVSENAYPTVSESVYPTVSENAYHNKELNKHINKQGENLVFDDEEEPPIKKPTKEDLIKNFFEKTWAMYHNKKGKASVSKEAKKEIFKLGDEFERCIERYNKEQAGTEIKFSKHGSTFFNGGYDDFLDKKYKTQNTKKEPVILEWVRTDA